jgi:hypothetical protein
VTAHNKTLLVIVSEALLEDLLIEEITALGVRGYTITEARGSGTHGVRRGKWTAGGNIRIEVIGDAELCARIVARLQTTYERDYGLLMFTSPVMLQS